MKICREGRLMQLVRLVIFMALPPTHFLSKFRVWNENGWERSRADDKTNALSSGSPQRHYKCPFIFRPTPTVLNLKGKYSLHPVGLVPFLLPSIAPSWCVQVPGRCLDPGISCLDGLVTSLLSVPRSETRERLMPRLLWTWRFYARS